MPLRASPSPATGGFQRRLVKEQEDPGHLCKRLSPSSLPPERSGLCCVIGGRQQFCRAACSPLGAHPVTLALARHEISKISIECLLNVGTWLSLHLELAAERGAPSLSALICTASPLQNGPILSVWGGLLSGTRRRSRLGSPGRVVPGRPASKPGQTPRATPWSSLPAGHMLHTQRAAAPRGVPEASAHLPPAPHPEHSRSQAGRDTAVAWTHVTSPTEHLRAFISPSEANRSRST